MKNFNFNILIILLLLLNANLFSQVDSSNTNIVNEPINLSGPRIGATFLSNPFLAIMKEKHDIELSPLLVQFGWHFEHRFFSLRSGATAVSEWILLVGGFGQEKFIPSISWILGFRSPSGIEFGVGPNLSLSGTSIVFATGITFQFDEINIPLNFAVATSKSGPRFSLLLGFNLRNNN